MSRLDELAIALILLIVVVPLGAFFLYLRTSYRNGGWKQVRIDLVIAIVALAAFAVLRSAENSDLEMLKEAVNRLTK